MPTKNIRNSDRMRASSRTCTDWINKAVDTINPMSHSPLLSLPLELRHMIYDQLFSSTIANDDSHINYGDHYREANEWPKTDIDDYISLTLVNKEIRGEAIPHFERYFLPTAKLYFDNLPDLHHASNAIELLTRRNPAYNKIKVSIHSTFVADWSCNERFESFLQSYILPNTLVSMAVTRAHFFGGANGELGMKTCTACGSRLHCFHQEKIVDGNKVKTKISAFRIPVQNVDVVAIWETVRNWEATMYIEAMAEMQYIDFGRLSKRQLEKDFLRAKTIKKLGMQKEDSC